MWARTFAAGAHIAVALGLLSVDPCAAATGANPPPGRVRNGAPTFDFPAVAALSTGSEFCTAVLIGCETVLTAAHCVCPEQGATYADCLRAGVADPAATAVFFQHAGFIGVSSIAVDPEYSTLQAGDVAILKLRRPVAGIAPMPINTLHQPAAGTNEIIVGFGRNEGSGTAPGLGIKRRASTNLTACPNEVPSDRFDCYGVTSGSAPSACPGDSGGPLLADLGSGLTVTTVLAGARGGSGVSSCQPPYTVLNTDTFRHRSFIAEQLAPDSSDGTCGALPAVGAAGTAARTFVGELGSGQPEFRASLDVPPGTTILRVTMNGVLVDGAGHNNNFDLFVKAGSPPSSTDFNYFDVNNSAYGAIEVVVPAAGTWHVLAQRLVGEGTVQLTATMFEDAQPPTPTPTVTHTPTRGPTSTPRPPAEECIGDCDGDGHIAIAELVRGVALALGNPVTPCADFDPDGDGVGIADLVKAVNGALYGCLAS